MFNGASVSEQEFGCSFFGYEAYWVNNQVTRAELLEEFEKFKWSGLSFDDYLYKCGKKKRFYKTKHKSKKNNKSKKK